jgi:hypothetical protein
MVTVEVMVVVLSFSAGWRLAVAMAAHVARTVNTTEVFMLAVVFPGGFYLQVGPKGGRG